MQRLLLTSLFLLASCHRVSGRKEPVPARERYEATVLLQTDSGKGPFIADAAIDTIVRVLRLARRAFPEGADITVRSHTGITVELYGTAAQFMESRFPVDWQGDTVLQFTAIPELDSLHARLGVRQVSVRAVAFMRRRTWLVDPRFPSPIYINEVSRMYEQIPGVRQWTFGTLMMGDWGGLTLARVVNGYRLGLSRRWGDCLSGCIHQHSWVFEIDLRTDRVVKVRDDGDPWPIPKSPDASIVNVPLP
ncbi:hypothetical protein [Gemmatimonas aurantiaca]|uniref:hypothetical protein n=1 Tax=Gemmatimonas aurantiaca TaxID=173480 RepID=UPI0012EA9966|nr:hypothetical protein [Gemmatimonas aurantiaca]